MISVDAGKVDKEFGWEEARKEGVWRASDLVNKVDLGCKEGGRRRVLR